jgi:hypothetical protein
MAEAADVEEPDLTDCQMEYSRGKRRDRMFNPNFKSGKRTPIDDEETVPRSSSTPVVAIFAGPDLHIHRSEVLKRDILDSIQ